jgi:hypothetical protein
VQNKDYQDEPLVRSTKNFLSNPEAQMTLRKRRTSDLPLAC